jgi:hypothetical protein
MTTTTPIPTAAGFEPLDPRSSARRRWRGRTVALVLLGLLGLLSWTSLRVTPDVVRAQQVLTTYVAAWNAGNADGVTALSCRGGRGEGWGADPVGVTSSAHIVQFDPSRAVAVVLLEVYGLGAPITVELRPLGWAGWCFDGIS